MRDLLLMFYLGGVTAGLGPAFGSKGQMWMQLLLTAGWPVLAIGSVLRLVLFTTKSEVS